MNLYMKGKRNRKGQRNRIRQKTKADSEKRRVQDRFMLHRQHMKRGKREGEGTDESRRQRRRREMEESE